MFVYLIVNDVNLKIYIGKTTRSNLRQYFQQKCYEARKHLGGSSHLYAAIRKYGRHHFHIYPLFEGSSNEELCEHEKLLIKTLKVRHPDVGYNICRGGEGFTGTWSKERHHTMPAKISKALKGKPKSESARRNMSLCRLGKKAKPSWLEKMQGRAPWNKGRQGSQAAWNKGKKMSSNFCEKRRIIQAGKRHSAETRAKMSVSHKIFREIKFLKTVAWG